MLDYDRKTWLIIISFIIIYFVWGSTYLANAWGVASVPPFLLAGTRFLIAGVILLGISRFFGPIKATSKQLKNSAIIGFMLFAIGNGLAVWSLKYIESGISAVVISLQPLIVAIMMWIFNSKKPKPATWAGIALGILGMILLVGQPKFITDPSALWGFSGLIIALFSWGYMAIWMPEADLPESMLTRTALQMLFGSIALLILSPIIGEWTGFDIETVPARAYWALLYLIVFGSLLAMTAFNFLLANVSPTKVVTNTYVNPIIAVFLGWWLNNEEITMQTIFAAVLLLLGVFFIIQARRKTQVKVK